jgi:hypothetical protein
MTKRFTKLTSPMVIAAATLVLVLSPTAGWAYPSPNVAHQLTRQIVQPQKSAADWDHDAYGFYTPTRSPGWNALNH